MSIVLNSEAVFTAYKAWCNEQVCEGCGKRFADRPRDDKGKALDVWVTEYECMKCFAKRCADKQAAKQADIHWGT